MTIKEFLSLPPDQQRLEAAKVLTDKPWKHDLVPCVRRDIDVPHGSYKCKKCDVGVWEMVDEKFTDCPVPDPIELNWNTAKRLQGELTEKERQRYRFGLKEVFSECAKSYIYTTWLIFEAQPIHYIVACMEVRGGFKETD